MFVRLRQWLERGSRGATLAIALALLVPVIARGRSLRVVSADAERDAIARGIEFLSQNRGHVGATSDLAALVVLDYLRRKYALPADLAFDRARDGAAFPDRMRTWGRFVGDRRPVDAESLGSLQGDPQIEELVAHALHCERFPLPAAYGALIARFADRGGYELTHAALALVLVRESGCSPGDGLPADIDDRLRRGMLALLDRRPADPRFEELDLRYEALAFLEDFAGERGIADDAIARVLVEQQPDGGWRGEADHGSRLHPTVLAVWALLAHLHPDAPRTSFAR
jgi:hypothetical protein